MCPAQLLKSVSWLESYVMTFGLTFRFGMEIPAVGRVRLSYILPMPNAAPIRLYPSRHRKLEKMKKGKDKKKKTKNLRTSKQTASRHLQAAEIPVAEMDEIAEPIPAPLPDPVPEGISEPVTVPEAEAVAELGSEPIPEPLPEPVPEIGDEAATAFAVEQGDIADVPVTRDNGAAEPGSQRAEEATAGPTTPREPVLLEYAQPNIR
jgi:hypothetical protein